MQVHGLGQVAQWLDCHPVHQKVAGLIPGQGTYIDCRFVLGGDTIGWKATNRCFSPSLSLLTPSTLSKINKQILGLKRNLDSSQDGGIGRNTLPPPTTKRRINTNLKTKNNQNFQKIKLQGSPTAKDLKKHSSRLVGGSETGSQGRKDTQQGSGQGGPGGS